MNRMNEACLASPTDAPQPARCRYVALVLLSAILLAGAAMRLHGLDDSLWVDELHTAWTISDSPGDIPHRAAMGNYSPAYFYLPWAATRMFGMHETIVRLPSLLAGIALIPLVYGIVVCFTSSRSAALLAAALAAIDQNFLLFSQEARSYSLVQLTGAAHMLLFWRLLIGRRWPDGSGSFSARRCCFTCTTRPCCWWRPSWFTTGS